MPGPNLRGVAPRASASARLEFARLEGEYRPVHRIPIGLPVNLPMTNPFDLMGFLLRGSGGLGRQPSEAASYGARWRSLRAIGWGGTCVIRGLRFPDSCFVLIGSGYRPSACRCPAYGWDVGYLNLDAALAWPRPRRGGSGSMSSTIVLLAKGRCGTVSGWGRFDERPTIAVTAAGWIIPPAAGRADSGGRGRSPPSPGPCPAAPSWAWVER